MAAVPVDRGTLWFVTTAAVHLTLALRGHRCHLPGLCSNPSLLNPVLNPPPSFSMWAALPRVLGPTAAPFYPAPSTDTETGTLEIVLAFLSG